MESLTQKQKDILDYIIWHVEANGFPPALTDIVKRFNFKSNNSPRIHLKALVKKGKIKIHFGVARGIQVL